MAQINTTADGASAKPMVRIEGLRKSFGDLEVLRDVNLDIMPGEVVTIIGASGSGKSTLLRCINLLETPDAGHVWFQGSDLTADHVDVNKLREDIGMVFQGFNLFNNMDVLDNCTLAPVTLKKATKQEAEQTAMHHLESVGLADFAARRRSQAVRWSKAARRHRPRAVHEPQDHAVRRAHQRP